MGMVQTSIEFSPEKSIACYNQIMKKKKNPKTFKNRANFLHFDPCKRLIIYLFF
jgi:hypothetical protein